MSYLINKAKSVATAAHASIGQVRKYTGDSYIVHPERVAYLVSLATSNENMIAAAWLHDVLEDVTPINPVFNREFIEEETNKEVAKLVVELTDISKPSDGNRAIRKKIDRNHIKGISPQAKVIKLADLIDNTKDILRHDKDFAKVYITEKRLLLPHLEIHLEFPEGYILQWLANQIIEDDRYDL